MAVALFGTVTSAIYCGLVVAAAVRFGAKRRRSLAKPADFVPAVSLLKPLHGAEPGLQENLRSFFVQKYAGPFEILFCARRQDDAGLLLARRLAAEHSAVEVRFFACGEPQFPNPKMYSLAVMAEAAKHDLLVTSDADARVAPDYLAQCVQEMRRPEAELASCLYLGIVDEGSLFLRLDALGKSVEMSSGVLVADMLSGTDFALGVTMVLRKKAFADAGGYVDLGNYWAEDFVLGNRLAAKGKGVAIAAHVIRLVVTADGAAHSFRNQLRWAQSTRRSRPWGHLGTGLTFATPFGLLGFLVEAARGRWIAAVLFLLAALANRVVQSAVVLRALGAADVVPQSMLYPLRDLLGSALWACSYLPADTRYHGTQFRIMPDGRLLRPMEQGTRRS